MIKINKILSVSLSSICWLSMPILCAAEDNDVDVQIPSVNNESCDNTLEDAVVAGNQIQPDEGMGNELIIFGLVEYEEALKQVCSNNIKKTDKDIIADGININLSSGIKKTVQQARQIVADFYSAATNEFEIQTLEIYLDHFYDVPCLVVGFHIRHEVENKSLLLRLYLFENGEIFPVESKHLLETYLLE